MNRNVFFAALLLSPGCLSAQQSCESLTALRLQNATIASAAMIDSAPLKPPPNVLRRQNPS